MVTAILSDHREENGVGTLVVPGSEFKTKTAHIDGPGLVQTFHETGPPYVGTAALERGDGQSTRQVSFE